MGASDASDAVQFRVLKNPVRTVPTRTAASLSDACLGFGVSGSGSPVYCTLLVLLNTLLVLLDTLLVLFE